MKICPSCRASFVESEKICPADGVVLIAVLAPGSGTAAFLAEAQIMRRLQHPHIVRVDDAYHRPRLRSGPAS